jgi:hypothetical protein
MALKIFAAFKSGTLKKYFPLFCGIAAAALVLGTLIGAVRFLISQRRKDAQGPAFTVSSRDYAPLPERERALFHTYTDKAQSPKDAGPLPPESGSFSPFAENVFLKYLELSDKNGNGTIDRGAGEGYEDFISRYGGADKGFFANGITICAANGRLEEAEIVNYYFQAIRFDSRFRLLSQNIEAALVSFMRTANLPEVWMDDIQGSVFKTVRDLLSRNGVPWPSGIISDADGERLFLRVLNILGIRSRPGLPAGGPAASASAGKNQYLAYYELAEFVNRRRGWSFEVAQFGFWFFSRLGISSVVVETMVSSEERRHGIRLNSSGVIIDYFSGDNFAAGISGDPAPPVYPEADWYVLNPLESLSRFYFFQYSLPRTETQPRNIRENTLTFQRQALRYSPYDISTAAALFRNLAASGRADYRELRDTGQFILRNTDLDRVMQTRQARGSALRNDLESVLFVLIQTYSAARNKTDFEAAEVLLNMYFRDDPKLKPFLDQYRF